MKLRTKYFFILLIASLVPMFAVTVISQKASRQLGKSISNRIQTELNESVAREIVSATQNYAMITRNAKMSMEFAILALKERIGLAMYETLPEPLSVYFDTDFDTESRAPDDLKESNRHLEVLSNGHLKKKKVSYNHPNFLLAPGVSQSDVRDDILRLSRVTPSLKRIAKELGDSHFWSYVSLESGLHLSYPGHGGYPKDYDPRQRPWYTAAKESGATNWSDPLMDITTNQFTFTVSTPFYHDEKLMGVAGIDVLIPNVLLESEISSQWSSRVRSFLVGHRDAAGSSKKEIWILSQGEKRPVKDLYVEVNNVYVPEHYQDFASLISHLNGGSSGSVEMPFKTVDSLWSYAEIFPGLHFVTIAPTYIITSLSEEVGYSFSSYAFGQRFISVGVVIAVVFVVAFLAWFISRGNNKKMIAVVKALKKLEKGDYSIKLDMKFSDERNMIVTTFNQIIPKLEEHLKMSRALGLAKDVQQSLLPKQNPEMTGFDIAGKSVYCDETGGDYYDFIPIEADRLAVVVGDVSGHGVSSSLLMATARALIMLRASMPGPAANIINDVNHHLSLDTYDTGNFMTFFYCEFSSGVSKINWVRAGHDPALIYDPETDKFEELKGRGLAFGLDYTFEYEAFERDLTSGMIILIGTDGIWEMKNETDQMFGKQRVKEIIRSQKNLPASQIISYINDELEAFRGNAASEDDVTMVVVKVD
jgi:sigma-B regulation protein RsbU (phosphoserine phosphatase)